MGIKTLYREYLQQLQTIYPSNEADAILQRLFDSVAGISRADIIKTPTLELTGDNSDCLQAGFQQLMEHCPLQYVLGEAWFYNMKLAVNENVLIPRPETEELVKLVIDDQLLNNQASAPLNIIDIGTGSGCIAIALKKNLPYANIMAVDLSAAALKLATQNANEQAVAIEFSCLDFLSETNWSSLPVFDTIVSNPPYIPVNEKEKLAPNVRSFEPALALFVPDNSPLLFYDKIASFGKEHLSESGKIFVEIHEDFAKETADLFLRSYGSVEIINDNFGRQRMIKVAR